MRGGLGLYGPLESKTPATMLAEIEDRAAASPLLRTAMRPCPRTLARGLTAATATPSRRADPRHRRNLRLRRTAVVGARAASHALQSVRDLAAGLPAPPGSPNEWLTQSRPAWRQRGNGESIRYRGARHRDKSGRQRWISTGAAARPDRYLRFVCSESLGRRGRMLASRPRAEAALHRAPDAAALSAGLRLPKESP
jgi:hypothetical protein